jgi:phage shock protein PspC (stress-responsive transcriptional regulator)
MDSTPDQSAAGGEPTAGRGYARLHRSRHDRMLAGVASGIADYAHVDALLVRIAFVALTFLGGAGVPLYLASWLLMPEEGSTHSIAADFTSGLQSPKN